MNTMTDSAAIDGIKNWLMESVSKMLMLPYDQIDKDAHLTELGMDSTEISSLMAQMEDWIGCSISSSIVEDFNTINELATEVHRLPRRK